MSKKNEPALADLLTQFDELVAWFERDDIDLEQAIEKFEAAERLADTIKARLHDLKLKVTVVKERFDRPTEAEADQDAR